MIASHAIANNEVEVKVTRIGKRWHARLMQAGTVKDEAACELKADVSWICRELLRWHHKLGGISKFARAARHRQSGNPQGKIWIGADMEKIRK
jgi:hypothetical protein